MTMIRGTCFTNIDDFAGVEWPTSFVAVPRVGEMVEGTRGTMRPTLRVVRVTHRMEKVNDGAPRPQTVPAIYVELHR